MLFPRVSTVNRNGRSELSSGLLDSWGPTEAPVVEFEDGIKALRVSTKLVASPFLIEKILILATAPGVSNCSMNCSINGSVSGVLATISVLLRSLTVILVAPRTPPVAMGSPFWSTNCRVLLRSAVVVANASSKACAMSLAKL